MLIRFFNNLSSWLSQTTRDIVATLIVKVNPSMHKKLIDGKNTPIEDCVPESEVEW